MTAVVTGRVNLAQTVEPFAQGLFEEFALEEVFTGVGEIVRVYLCRTADWSIGRARPWSVPATRLHML